MQNLESILGVHPKILLKISQFPQGVNHKSRLASFHFCSFFLRKSKLVAGKEGRCAEKASAGKEFQPEIRPCFRRMGRAYRAPGRAPLQGNNPVLGKRRTCPPGPRNDARLMVFSRNALPSGPGNGRNSIEFITTCRKVKGGRQMKTPTPVSNNQPCAGKTPGRERG